MCLRTIQKASLTEASPTIGFPGGIVVKNLPANAGEEGLIPGLGRSSGEATHSSILAWRIPGTEETGGLQSMGLQGVRHNLLTKTTKVLLLILFNDSAWRLHIRDSDLYIWNCKKWLLFSIIPPKYPGRYCSRIQ